MTEQTNDHENRFKEYNDKGITGLANLGNTCFANACLQCLSHTYELNVFLDKETYKGKLRKKYDSALIVEWDALRKVLWNENCIVAPNKFLKTIQKVAELKGMDIFTGYSQNDLPEFLLFIIDCFHTSLSREIKMTISGKPEKETTKKFRLFGGRNCGSGRRVTAQHRRAIPARGPTAA